MDDVLIFEAAHHVNDGIHPTDVPQELVPQTLALAGPLHQAGDIQDLDGGGEDPFGIDEFSDPVHAGIGNLDDTHIGIDSAERIIGRLGASRGQCIENSGFPHVGETDDTAVETHLMPSFRKK